MSETTEVAISTSTSVLSLAVKARGAIVSETLRLDRRHAEEITPILKRLSTGLGQNLDHVDKVWVDVGPGRFTGLRVGIATAVGIALGAECEIRTVSSVDVLRSSLQYPADRVLCLIDARRGELFAKSFDSAASSGVKILKPVDLTLDDPDCVIIGDGADLYWETHLAASCVGRYIPQVTPEAQVMFGMETDSKVAQVDSLEPMYIREPDAVPNIKTRTNDPRVQQ